MEKDRLINLGLALPRAWVLSPKLVLTDRGLRNPQSSESSKTGRAVRVRGKGTPINGSLEAHRRIFRGREVTLFRDRKIRRQPWAPPVALKSKKIPSYMETCMGTNRNRPPVSRHQTLEARELKRPVPP